MWSFFRYYSLYSCVRLKDYIIMFAYLRDECIYLAIVGPAIFIMSIKLAF